MKKFFLFLCLNFCSFLFPVPFWELSPDFAKSILSKMSLREKVGQLFVSSAASYDLETDKNMIERLIGEYKIGGLMFMYGTPKKQAQLVNHYQKLSKIPLLISQDCEWGLSMRLKGPITFPLNLTLGALQAEDDHLVYEVGREIGRQCLLVGTRVNFAPVVDVNNNPKNPIIHIRSFGEDPTLVTAKALAYMKGLQSKGVMACAKHFPGHGNVDLDSHLDLPTVHSSKKELIKIELSPFKKLFDAGVLSIMTAHLYVPALEKKSNLPSTFSSAIMTDLLQEEMGFKGLVFTDALKMGAIRKKYNAAESALKAFLAGNDLLMFGDIFLFRFGEPTPQETFNDVISGIDNLEKVIKDNALLQKKLDEKVLKILLAKQSLGLFENKTLDENISDEDFNSQSAKKLKQKIFDKALTLVKNEDCLIPLKKNGKEIAAVFIGKETKPGWKKLLNKKNIKSYYFSDLKLFGNKLSQTNKASMVIVSIYLERRPMLKDNFGITPEILSFLDSLNKQSKKVLLVLYGTPYALKFLQQQRNVLVAYENEVEAEIACEKILLGKISPRGKLPVNWL